MKKRIVLILFILNSLFLLVYFFPFFKEMTHIFLYSDAAAIGIIGGVDGPTAIFLTSQINWFPIAIIILEIILGICLFISRSKNNSV